MHNDLRRGRWSGCIRTRRGGKSAASPTQRTITTPAAGNDWSVLIVVEEEFTGFVAADNRKALLMALAVVGVAALIAGLLVRQGLRADRAARALLHRTRPALDLLEATALY